MLILPAFIHAWYYIRIFLSSKIHNGIFLTITFFNTLLQFSIICLKGHFREKWRHGGQSDKLWAQEDGVLLRLRNLMMAQGHLIMAPISKVPHQHQSGSYLEELHDLRLCRPPWIKPFIICWHFCPALNVCTPWESDKASETWWVMDNLRLCKGWQTVCRSERGAGRGLPAMPTASPGRCHHLSTALGPWPLSPEVADSLQKRNHPQQMGPLTLAGPSKHCVLVTCHLLLFSGWNTSRQGLSVLG